MLCKTTQWLVSLKDRNFRAKEKKKKETDLSNLKLNRCKYLIAFKCVFILSGSIK